MSHSGNSSARRRKNLPHLRTQEAEQLYNPSVFRYKCIGYLKLNSEHKGSPGVCKGLQSRIERVANMVPATREDSIKRFLDAASDHGTYVDESDDSSDQKVKEIYTSRTMIYKDDSDDHNDDNKARIHKAPKSSVPEEDLIDKTEWSCYGSTQVHYLVLDPVPTVKKVPNRPDPNLPPEIAEAERQAEEMFDVLSKQLQNLDDHFNNNNNKKKKDKERQVVTKVATSSGKGGKITAITPENFGLSIRKIDSEVGHFTVTDIGSIRICLETSGSLMGDDTKPEAAPKEKNKQQSQSGTDKQQPGLIGASSQKKKKEETNSNEDEDSEKTKKPSPFDPKTFYNFTLKVGQHMQQNVHAINEAVADDFPGRTMAFGTKVVHRFTKTTEQTFSFMAKVFDGWWKSP